MACRGSSPDLEGCKVGLRLLQHVESIYAPSPFLQDQRTTLSSPTFVECIQTMLCKDHWLLHRARHTGLGSVHSDLIVWATFYRFSSMRAEVSSGQMRR